MNPKLFLALILLLSILINLLLTVREGACSYVDNGGSGGSSGGEPEYTGAPGAKQNSLEKSGAPVSGTSPSTETCQNTTIYENKENSDAASKKLNELKEIVKKTKESIFKNKKDISANKRNNKALQNAVKSDSEEDSDDEGGAEDPCDDYPEAC